MCGKVFDCGNDFECRDHMLLNHEEGRDYIKCQICGGLVRDLRLHYATKHRPKRVPKNIRTKVIVWRDFDFNGKFLREHIEE